MTRWTASKADWFSSRDWRFGVLDRLGMSAVSHDSAVIASVQHWVGR